jgi:hypothetical protein
MKDKTEQRILLEPEKVEFLQTMAKSYQLPDIGKAVRCLIDYARENTEKQAEYLVRFIAMTADGHSSN